jgi:high-affinity nickel-transport protein
VAAHSLLSWPTLSIGGTGFLLGCRHGLDWDHLAAITDLTTANAPAGASGARRTGRNGRTVSLALWYCIGHGLVIAALGAVVGVLGVGLPAGIDRIFEGVVGATLVALGAFVLWQLGRDRGEYRYAGRVKLLVGIVRRAWSRARRRGTPPAGALDDLGPRSAFAVGVLHGTGAETPTQVVLFASAAASGSTAGAMFILLAFVTGLIVSDLGIAAAWLAGLVGVRRSVRAQLVLGGLTGVSSLAVGGLFLAGRAAELPALFGG